MSARSLSRLTCAHLMPIQARLLFARPTRFDISAAATIAAARRQPLLRPVAIAIIPTACSRHVTRPDRAQLASSSPGPHTRPTSEKMWTSGREIRRSARSIQHSSTAVASESVHRAPADRNFGMEMQRIDTAVPRTRSGPFGDEK